MNEPDETTEYPTFNVTLTDIKKGCPCSPGKCPIARALKRKFRTRDVIVSNKFATVGEITWILTPEMQRFVIAFDKTQDVQPKTFSFEFPARPENLFK